MKVFQLTDVKTNQPIGVGVIIRYGAATGGTVVGFKPPTKFGDAGRVVVSYGKYELEEFPATIGAKFIELKTEDAK